MTKSIKTNWWLLLLAGIIFLILAVKVMMHPAGSIIGLAFFIGWASLIAGVFQVSFALSAKNVIMNWVWRLFSGIINIIIGIVFLSHPALTAQILPFLVGFWMIFVGVSAFINGVQVQSSKITGGWVDMLLGLFVFIGGMWISYHPVAETAMLIWLISFTLMFYGIYFIVISLQLSKMK